MKKPIANKKTGIFRTSFNTRFDLKKMNARLLEQRQTLRDSGYGQSATHQFTASEELIVFWIKNLSSQNRRITVTELVDAITPTIEALNNRCAIREQLHVPSKTTLWRSIKETDRYETDLHQKGNCLLLKNQQRRQNNSPLFRPLERMEVDTQKMDAVVRSAHGDILGRPFLTLFFDIKSRCVNGYDVSLTPPCIEKTLRGLSNGLASASPNAGTGQYHILENSNKFAGKKSSKGMDLLGAHIIFCEPYSPNQKPHVERWFKTLHTQFSHLSGTKASHPEDSRYHKPAYRTTYTLEELILRFEDCFKLCQNNIHNRQLNR